MLAIIWVKTAQGDKEKHEKTKTDFNEEYEKYQLLLEEFQQNNEFYLKQKKTYDHQVQSLLSEESITLFRKKSIQEWQSSRIVPKFMPCSVEDIKKRGVSELFFADELKKKGYDVFVDKKVRVGSTFYFPDIILVKDGLFVDVEIDEPYSGGDGSPIHYLYKHNGIMESIDSDRNAFFIKQGFEVVRFSEEQVLLHAQECIQFIQSFISSICKGGEKLVLPSNIVLKKWTKEQAHRLAYQKYRNTYVPKQMLKYINEETNKSYLQIRKDTGLSNP